MVRSKAVGDSCVKSAENAKIKKRSFTRWFVVFNFASWRLGGKKSESGKD